ncbi:hypothetical protein LCGC14_0437790 [marine sediment metagenome]|uniref:Disease resistance R13L4/SHOC-2-like LRR domain-containing protein n=1 Tax=marine sediment metagenome TaxID=412755 RepID=A0A0F9SL89_9ZZZZ
MAILSPTIIAGDLQQDIEDRIVDICGVEFHDYLHDDRILTQEIFEQHFEEILEFIESRNNYIYYQVLGYFILKTGATLPSYLRDTIDESTNWEYDKEQRWPNHWLNLRRFYLNDLRKKIRAHKSGVKTNLFNLKISSDDELSTLCIGLDSLLTNDLIGRHKEVTHVNLDYQGLKEFPTMVFRFENLTKLSIENNQIITIPSEINQLRNLQELYLGFNKIESIPETISHLRKLKILFLARNNLETLPDSIGGLESLKEIFLFDNLIWKLPESFLKLKGKCFVNLENNRLKNNPFAIDWDSMMPDLDSK